MTEFQTYWTEWLYTEDRLALRAQCLLTLLREFGGVEIHKASYNTRDLFECAHDWVSFGNQSPIGIVEFFKSNYEIKESS